MYTDPVVGEMFFGRREVLSLMSTRVRDLKDGFRQNIAITGHRLSGKSSVLHQFVCELDDPGIIAIYMEMVPEPFRDFARRFLGSILHSFLSKSDMEPTEDLSELISRAAKVIPGTAGDAEQIVTLIEKGDFETAYGILLGITSTIREESGKICVMILDEFHNLNGLEIKNPFNLFGKKIMIQKDTMYIVSSSQIDSLKNIVNEKLALLFGNFQMVELKGFSYTEAFMFIKSRLKGFNVDDALIRFLIHFTDGYPFHIDSIVKRVKEICAIKSVDTVDREVISEAVEQLVFNSDGSINRYFLGTFGHFFEDPEKSRLAHVLVALANGNRRTKDISKWLKSNKDLGKVLNRLCELNLIFKDGSFYQFYDSLFCFWIRDVHGLKKMTLSSDSMVRLKKFRERLASAMTDFILRDSMPVEDRVGELLKKFNNDLVQVDSRSHKMPKVKSCKVINKDDKAVIMTCSTNRGRWGVCVSASKCSEQDILNFCGIFKSQNSDIKKRVLIVLSDIEPDVRIIAKDEKFWLWDTSSLNNYMETFDLAKVILTDEDRSSL